MSKLHSTQVNSYYEYLKKLFSGRPTLQLSSKKSSTFFWSEERRKELKPLARIYQELQHFKVETVISAHVETHPSQI